MDTLPPQKSQVRRNLISFQGKAPDFYILGCNLSLAAVGDEPPSPFTERCKASADRAMDTCGNPIETWSRGSLLFVQRSGIWKESMTSTFGMTFVQTLSHHNHSYNDMIRCALWLSPHLRFSYILAHILSRADGSWTWYCGINESPVPVLWMCMQHAVKQNQHTASNTLQGTKISHLGKRKINFKTAFGKGYVSSLEGTDNGNQNGNHL